MSIESDLSLTQSEGNWAVALFFLAYVRMHYPSFFICHRVHSIYNFFSLFLNFQAIFSCDILIRPFIYHSVCWSGVVLVLEWLS